MFYVLSSSLGMFAENSRGSVVMDNSADSECGRSGGEVAVVRFWGCIQYFILVQKKSRKY